MSRFFRGKHTDNEPVPERRPPLDDGTGDAQAAPQRIIGRAQVPKSTDLLPPGRSMLTRGQRERTKHPEAGINE
ncbi:hypothetical protein AB0A95_33820 [Micromonospora sp. NPDC049230]|uniref:hypothetical protein n=1 Tax=Micromonospora sp. NPDC049230 TaxID=3155502 RepID=UPI0034110101